MNDRELRPLAQAIEGLTAFLKANLSAATKQDLKEMEKRILAAMKIDGISKEDKALLDSLLRGSEASLKRLEALDAKN